MAAGTAQLLRTGRTGEISPTDQRWEALYQVLTTDKNDGPLVVAVASGIPAFNSIYSIGSETDLGARVVSIVPTQDTDNPQKWEVRVVWSTQNQDPLSPDTPGDPTLRPNIIRWRMEPYQEAADRDRDGNLIQTVNGEWFDPFPEVTRYRPVVNIQKNFLTFNDALMFSYVGAVNSDTWLGGSANFWLCRDLNVEPMYEFNIAYKRVTGEFVYNRDTWSLVLPHKGTLYKNSASSTVLTFDPGRPLVHLTTAGVRSSTHVATLSFNLYPAQSFSALGLV